MRVGSLFSGIGGIDLGLERAGMTVCWQVENDPYCSRVLAKHWPHVTRYGDIRAMDWSTVEPVDLVAGGFPCQPVSLAGKRLGQADERWLWPEFARCVRTLRPRFVLVENVPGLLVRGFGDVLGDLAACGYEFAWDVVSAAEFGAPHRRARLFIVAHSMCEGLEREGAAVERSQCDWWDTAPSVCGVADGIPRPVVINRLRGLGNAVVPQCVEWIGRRIMEHAR